MFLEEFFIRGMSLKDATGMVVDMLMAGIDTVISNQFINTESAVVNQIILCNRRPTQRLSSYISWQGIQKNKKSCEKKYFRSWDPKAR
jgi:hypothetical protein